MLLYNLLCTGGPQKLSDTGKSMAKKKPEGHSLIIKLILSLWLLYKNYINYVYGTLISKGRTGDMKK